MGNNIKHSQALFRENSYLTECSAQVIAIDENGIVLDQTVFYPQGGGQQGDIGQLKLKNNISINIIDCRKIYDPVSQRETIFHVIDENEREQIQHKIAIGEAVFATIDWSRRLKTMRMHTAAHLLCAILPYPVNGCSITDQHARMDFVTNELIDKTWVSEKLCQLIEESLNITMDWISAEDLRANPSLLRTMFVQPPQSLTKIRLVKIGDIDCQPCGGTHVANTTELGKMQVTKTKKVNALSRRVIVEFAES